MISFADAPQNLFNRLGRLGSLVSTARTYQDDQLDNIVDAVDGVVNQFDSEPDIQAQIGNAYIGFLDAVGSSIGSTVTSMAAATVNRMVFRDNPLLNQTLLSSNTLGSLLEIIRQMYAAGATIRACTVTATPSAFTGTGNAVVNASVRRPLDGRVLENAFSESILLRCSADSYSGQTAAGNESLTVTGVGNQGNVFSFDWPLGSNAQTAISVIDGNTNNGAGNLLTNSSFDSWTSNVPDNWELVVGTAGTNIAQENTITYDSTSSVQIIGAGSAETQIRQIFDDSDGTSASLSPLTQYSFCIFARRDGVAAGAGVLTIELVDGNGDVILDEAGTANSFNIDLTALTTVFTGYTGVFRTPEIMPATQYLRMRLSTPLTNGRSIYLDKGSLGLMTQVYRSGPFVAAHAASIPLLLGDRATVAVVNGRGAGGTLDTFQTLMARLFVADVMGQELLFPSSSTPTISDNLITS